MGYSIRYDLQCKNYKENREISLKEKGLILGLLEDRDVIDYALNENFECEDGVNWFDHEEDMKYISDIIPDILFCLHGEGEVSGDIWEKYFLGGKMQAEYAKIIIDPFDFDKLK